jgi:uncharacterized protein
VEIAYLVAPVAGWLAAGSTKFLVNCARSGRLAFDQIGYGGMPSTHSSIVSTPAVLIGLREGWNTPVFSVAAALVLIVALDATSLRRQIGVHASLLNVLAARAPEWDRAPLRERMGHRRMEVLAGIAVGALIAASLHAAF